MHVHPVHPPWARPCRYVIEINLNSFIESVRLKYTVILGCHGGGRSERLPCPGPGGHRHRHRKRNRCRRRGCRCRPYQVS
jgi:hypothetical protein